MCGIKNDNVHKRCKFIFGNHNARLKCNCLLNHMKLDLANNEHKSITHNTICPYIFTQMVNTRWINGQNHKHDEKYPLPNEKRNTNQHETKGSGKNH